MKKLFSALLAATLILTPVGSFVFQDHSTTVEAKRYKSGKKGFNMNQNRQQHNQSNFQQKQQQKQQPKNNQQMNQNKPKGGLFSGGLMRGLMFGGLAGLLFGSLFANMGILGSLLGLLINVGAIILLITLIRKVFSMLKKQKKREDMNPWGS